MIYFFIAFGASLIGAISGLGGGVIIKPILNLVGAKLNHKLPAKRIATVFNSTIAFIILASLFNCA